MILEDTYKDKGLRKSLINTLKEKGIKDNMVLDALNRVPRHFFFEKAFHSHAYQDKAFPIGEGQTISQPFTVARQSELLAVQPGDKILEIGTGSGYQSCVLLELGAKLYSIEVKVKLYKETKKLLTQMGYKGDFFCTDGSKGLPQFGPFNKILVTAGAPFIPNTLIEQLEINGKLVIPVGDRKSQKMIRVTKISDKELSKEEFGDYKFVPLMGTEAWKFV